MEICSHDDFFKKLSQVIKLLRTLVVVSSVLVSSVGNAQVQPDPTRYEYSIVGFENQDFQVPPPAEAILLIGSSSIGFWNEDAPFDLAPLTVIPRGFGGSVMNDVIYYFNRIVRKYNPRAIVLYEGDNDLVYGLTPATILDQLDQIITLIKSNLPNTRLYLLSVKPSIARSNLWGLAQQVNSGFSDRAGSDEDIFHVEVDKYLLSEGGDLRPELYRADQLHLNEAGYDIWADVIRAALTVQESRFESTTMGTTFYATTTDLLSDCITLLSTTGEDPIYLSLGFYLIDGELAIKDFAIREATGSSCSDTLNVSPSADGSVATALYQTNSLFVRGSGIRYRLSAEHSATRRPLGPNRGLYLFDKIEFEIID